MRDMAWLPPTRPLMGAEPGPSHCPGLWSDEDGTVTSWFLGCMRSTHAGPSMTFLSSRTPVMEACGSELLPGHPRSEPQTLPQRPDECLHGEKATRRGGPVGSAPPTPWRPLGSRRSPCGDGGFMVISDVPVPPAPPPHRPCDVPSSPGAALPWARPHPRPSGLTAERSLLQLLLLHKLSSWGEAQLLGGHPRPLVPWSCLSPLSSLPHVPALGVNAHKPRPRFLLPRLAQPLRRLPPPPGSSPSPRGSAWACPY